MGNRAYVIFADGAEISPAIYLHWNGGPESVYAFLEELETRGFNKERGADVQYAAARFLQVVADFFGITSMLSIGLTNGPAELTPEALLNFNPGDNGVYVVGWKGQNKDLLSLASGKARPPRWSVRRFEGVYGEDGTEILRELSQVEVQRERKAAKRHEYASALREQFDKIRTGLKAVAR